MMRPPGSATRCVRPLAGRSAQTAFAYAQTESPIRPEIDPMRRVPVRTAALRLPGAYAAEIRCIDFLLEIEIDYQ
jgi:hypothetical protein